MKIPCEVVVWHILPTIRKELAKELVVNYNMSQADVAKKFGITDAAVSQYLKNKRGNPLLTDEKEGLDYFMEAIRDSAEKIVKDETNIEKIMCEICEVTKKNGMLSKIYKEQLGYDPPSYSCNSIVEL